MSDSSFGYHGSNFATVMAYPAADGSKPWIEMMSNPGVLYNGESTGAEGYANVAEAQNYSLPIISNYRRDALSKLYLPFVSR